MYIGPSVFINVTLLSLTHFHVHYTNKVTHVCTCARAHAHMHTHTPLCVTKNKRLSICLLKKMK